MAEALGEVKPLDEHRPLVPRDIPPTERELELMQTVVDPLDVRQLEVLRGSRRRQALEAILARERAEVRSM